MLFVGFTAMEGLMWWQLAAVESARFWTGATLAAWDFMEAIYGGG